MMTLTSKDFKDGDEMPRRFTGEGEDRNPSLEWSDVPMGTREFAIVCEDPDAPGETPYVHWVMYGIPGATRSIPEGLPSLPAFDLPIRAKQGTNSAGTTGYEGPMPPKGHGWHHYHFRLYALDRELKLRAGLSSEELAVYLSGHVLAETVFTGKYKREVVRKVA
jgi:Raf kinase inhibitor-like YbhB/YbcL family protein